MSDLFIGLYQKDGLTEEFNLPTSLGTQTSALVGIRGSGKTVTASVVVEELLEASHQVIIIDPTDVWWGLKSNADGLTPAFPVVVFGGPHGDLPLEPGMGPALADFAVEQRPSMILSLRHLRKGQQQSLVTAFAEQLYHRKGESKYRTPVLVVIDEASTFVPQKVMGESARMVGAIEDLVRKGRASGLGVMLVDQRPASVNKDVLTQLEVLIAHQITAPHDRKALLEWIRQHDTAGGEKAFLEQLSSLPNGTAWIWSPALDVFDRVAVRMRYTFDSSKTPKPGDVPAAPLREAYVDLEAIRGQLDKAIAEAEENDPKALRRRIKELEAAGDDTPEVDYWMKRAMEAERRVDAADLVRRKLDAVRLSLATMRSKLEEVEGDINHFADLLGQDKTPHGNLEVGDWQDAYRGFDDRMDRIDGVGEYARPKNAPGSIKRAPTAPMSSEAPIAQRAKAAAAKNGNGRDTDSGLSVSERKILDALGTFGSFGIPEVEPVSVAILAGYRPGGGRYNNLKSGLRARGLIEYVDGRIRLTQEGRSLARGQTFSRLEQLHAAWFEILDNSQQKILTPLLESYPRPIYFDVLANTAGYTPGAGRFNNLRSSLKTLGAIEYPAPGTAKASDILFPPGLV